LAEARKDYGMFCDTCKDKKCLKTGRPCKEVEKYLKSQGIKKAGYMNPKEEIPVIDIEQVGLQRAFELKYGKRKD